ncbi:hypothetical protein GSY69_04385 [Brevibacterium sp. 5221]|uniref:DUF2975 domain-containing protein n=1 Tax=Brevibacterium rongguiense TaxID=2695267 RepID=A0A6N9H5S0_9MICO|nr:hypothetical protein [Brevibacterium rongguiense]MYM19225.1 hypothetical protein [Brevibacterium rongguiense]
MSPENLADSSGAGERGAAPRGQRSGAAGGRPRSGGRGGLEMFSLLAVAALVVHAATGLIRAVTSHELTVALERPAGAAGGISGVEAARAEGVVTFAIGFDQLSGASIATVLAAQASLLLGGLVAGWAASRAIGAIAAGRPLSGGAARRVLTVFWATAATGAAYGLLLMLGGNLVTRDLGIFDQGYGNGVTTWGILGWIGVLGLIQVFYRALRRGAQAEDELEGVI